MFEQTFKNIDDILHKDAGCGSELDYVEQTSWILFLKYLDDLEKDKATAAELSGKTYTNILAMEFQWTVGAAPKDKDCKLDHHKALTGDDLKDYVDLKLFPSLKKFKTDAESADTIEYKIGEIFSELKNRIQSGYNLREVINRIDELRFRTHAEKHEMSHLYEDKIKNMWRKLTTSVLLIRFVMLVEGKVYCSKPFWRNLPYQKGFFSTWTVL